MSIKDEKELGKALKEDRDEIIIEGDLKNNVIRIKAIGKVAWAIAIAAIAVAVGSVLAAPLTGGLSTTANFITAPVAVSVLGVPAAGAAISIAVAGGGVKILDKLRDYKIVEKNGNSVILKKR